MTPRGWPTWTASVVGPSTCVEGGPSAARTRLHAPKCHGAASSHRTRADRLLRMPTSRRPPIASIFAWTTATVNPSFVWISNPSFVWTSMCDTSGIPRGETLPTRARHALRSVNRHPTLAACRSARWLPQIAADLTLPLVRRRKAYPAQAAPGLPNDGDSNRLGAASPSIYHFRLGWYGTTRGVHCLTNDGKAAVGYRLWTLDGG